MIYASERGGASGWCGIYWLILLGNETKRLHVGRNAERMASEISHFQKYLSPRSTSVETAKDVAYVVIKNRFNELLPRCHAEYVLCQLT